MIQKSETRKPPVSVRNVQGTQKSTDTGKYKYDVHQTLDLEGDSGQASIASDTSASR